MSMLFLFLLCALRGNGVDRDYETYINIFNYIVEGYPYAIEPSFYIITFISNSLVGSFSLIFVIYAALAILFKTIFIKKWSPYIMLSVLLYYSNTFFLHEMTQIRIGLASAIGFYSLKYLLVKEIKKYYVGVFFAILFHYSMVVFVLFPLLSFSEISLRFKVTYLIILTMSYVLHFLDIDFSSVINILNIDIVQHKYNMYKIQGAEDGMQVNVFSSIQILHIIIVCFGLLYVSIYTKDRRYNILMKIFAFSPLCLIGFSSIPGFSLRLSELFSLSEIVLIPLMISKLKQKNIAFILAIFLALAMILLNLFYGDLVKEYVF